MKGVEHTFSVFKEYEKAVIYLSNNKLTMFTSLFSVVCLSLTMLLLIAFIVTLHLHIHVLNVLDSLHTYLSMGSIPSSMPTRQPFLTLTSDPRMLYIAVFICHWQVYV